jgi:hypothetical protein
VAESDRAANTDCLLQKALERVISLEYEKCDYMANRHSNKNPLTYQFYLETTKPRCCTQNKEVADGENTVETDVLVAHVHSINQFASKHRGVPLPEEE